MFGVAQTPVERQPKNLVKNCGREHAEQRLDRRGGEPQPVMAVSGGAPPSVLPNSLCGRFVAATWASHISKEPRRGAILVPVQASAVHPLRAQGHENRAKGSAGRAGLGAATASGVLPGIHAHKHCAVDRRVAIAVH